MSSFVIIGASSGIGRNLAERLNRSGHQVFGTYRNNHPGSDLPGLSYHYLDVMEEQPDFSFLPDRIDGLAYCPGSIQLKPFRRIKPQEFMDDLALQLGGAVKALQAALPGLSNSDSASVVLFSTVAVQTGFTFHTQVSSSKGAVEGFTRALAAELAPKVRVNCIAPSITSTPLAQKLLNTEAKIQAAADRHPLKRVGQAGDIAGAAAFLLGAESEWITGQVLHVDGGISNLKTH